MNTFLNTFQSLTLNSINSELKSQSGFFRILTPTPFPLTPTPFPHLEKFSIFFHQDLHSKISYKTSTSQIGFFSFKFNFNLLCLGKYRKQKKKMKQIVVYWAEEETAFYIWRYGLKLIPHSILLEDDYKTNEDYLLAIGQNIESLMRGHGANEVTFFIRRQPPEMLQNGLALFFKQQHWVLLPDFLSGDVCGEIKKMLS